MMQSISVGAPSRFVNFLAWALIGSVAAGMALLLTRWLLPASWASGSQALTHLWAASAPLASWVAALGMLLVAATLACAIGLLMRLDWARKAVMVLLACWASLWLLVLPLAHWVAPRAQNLGSGQLMLSILAWLLPGLCGCVLAAWAVARLRSMGVRREFL